MKKRPFISRLTSLALSAMLVLSMAISAIAASGGNKIVINDPNDDTGAPGRFIAYQIFKGTLNTEKNELTVTGWGDSVDGTKLLQAMKESVSTVPDAGGDTTFGGQFTKAYGEYEKSYDSQLTVAEFVAQWLAKVSEGKTGRTDGNPYAGEFARLVANNLKAGLQGTESVKTKFGDQGGQWTIDLPEPGYYLVKDTYSGTAASVSSYILSVAGTETINIKASIPTVDKEVVDDHGHMSEGAIYRPFEAITYTITGTVAKNIDEYKTYEYIFNDTLSEGLDLVKYDQDTAANGATETQIAATADESDVTAKAGIEIYLYNGSSKPADLKTVTDAAKAGTGGSGKLASGWVAKYKTGEEEGTKVLTVSFADLKASARTAGADLKAGSYIIMVYAAMMNKDAISGSDGNPNKATITYSNDPYSTSKGTTAVDEPKVYTVGFNLAKVDGSNKDNPLEGASFKLKRWNWTAIEEEDGKGEDWNKVDGSFTGKIEWAIAEKVPDGAGEGIPKFVIQGWTDKEDSATKMAAGTGGKMQIVGFRGFGVKHDAGTDHVYQANYALVETTVPEGYQKIEDLIFTVKITVDTKGNLSAATIYRHDSNKNRQDVELDNDKHSLLNHDSLATLKVRNYKSPLLPFTGGIGTLIFYVVGGLLVAGAVTCLVVSARRRKDTGKEE